MERCPHLYPDGMATDGRGCPFCLGEELDDWRASATRAPRCDEVHCSCVGPMQKGLEEAGEALKAAGKRILELEQQLKDKSP